MKKNKIGHKKYVGVGAISGAIAGHKIYKPISKMLDKKIDKIRNKEYNDMYAKYPHIKALQDRENQFYKMGPINGVDKNEFDEFEGIADVFKRRNHIDFNPKNKKHVKEFKDIARDIYGDDDEMYNFYTGNIQQVAKNLPKYKKSQKDFQKAFDELYKNKANKKIMKRELRKSRRLQNVNSALHAAFTVGGGIGGGVAGNKLRHVMFNDKKK